MFKNTYRSPYAPPKPDRTFPLLLIAIGTIFAVAGLIFGATHVLAIGAFMAVPGLIIEAICWEKGI